ncbi:spermatogenesis-associated protein 6 [Callorhinchus milii]|uniref:spermatogenesis-associated protein 6 n=1 Tax=Callorhinchus milii TaxID=7868 RepID=UPI0004574ECF|nr:spermatogenesis-associated protein 6 [Callorhinchus milii]|eukprot:gi/632950571/ref/XP_007890795.1/ PREDICTED: spermatogenesis associated 6-like protein [Callorhinchus milii]
MVTCPGVILPRKDDILLRVCVLGQHWKTRCIIPVFPLLIHESVQFEKVFGKDIIDPADVAEFLECDIVKFELLHLTPTGDEPLAIYEENTRPFLFPEPKLTPTYPGVDREVLMRRCSQAFAISPKLEFSTTTTITECCIRYPKRISSSSCLTERKENHLRKVKSTKSFNIGGKGLCEKKSDTCRKPVSPSSSRQRSPSAYCRRCLLELSLDDGQISDLSPERKDCKIDFGSKSTCPLRHSDKSASEKRCHSGLSSSSSFEKRPKARSRPSSPSCRNHDFCRSLFSPDKSKESDPYDEFNDDTSELKSYPISPSLRQSSSEMCEFPNHSAPQRRSSNLLSNSTSQSCPFDPVRNSAWERIHERVQNLLANIDAQEMASGRNVNFTGCSAASNSCERKSSTCY